MKKPKLVTSALPYANGPLHIGHMLEFVQTDIYVRFLRLKGEQVIYCCADDTHGTPIEVNAAKHGKTPEAFVKEWYKKHLEELRAYLISLDSYHTTNSPENKYFTELLFNRLKDNENIYTKEIELTFCSNCKRFLPDRYVKGICPKCGALEQYGDVCEKCNSTYSPVELIQPRCTICGNTPERKNSMHYFFKLSKFSKKLEKYIRENKRLQPEIKNQILEWIKKGLEDWCISRDGPYFGFKIPGEEDKYFYVWLDAPVGYMASLANYFKGNIAKAEEFWNNSGIVHFIGKDIVYFHLLFWPAVLIGAGFKAPDSVVVHGFLNVNSEKMSKSRGTFLTASDFRKNVEPEFLRYYFASSLTHTMTDIDLDIENFIAKANNELVGNIANFAYRTLSFINKNFESRLAKARDNMLLKSIAKKVRLAGDAYERLDYREAIRLALEVGDEGNKYFQNNKPWALVKENKEETHKVLTDCANIVKMLALALKPVLPNFSESLGKQLNAKLVWEELESLIEERDIGQAEIILKKIEDLKLDLPATEKKEGPDPFSLLNLKVAKVTSVSEHYKADKLLLINIDLGTETRQLVAGLKPYYPDTSVLVGKHIIVLTNLEHADLRGERSEGMLLAAETEDSRQVKVLEAPNSKPGEQVFIEGITPRKETIKFDDFLKVKIYVHNREVMYKGKQLQTKQEKLRAGIDKGRVR